MCQCLLLHPCAGIRRFGEILGIHRPYMSEEAYRELSAHDALDADKYLRNEISKYLNEMGVAQSYLDRMYAIPKNQIEWVHINDLVRDFNGLIPELSEWAVAKCGPLFEDIYCYTNEVYENSMSQKRKYMRDNNFQCQESVQ